MATTNGGPHHIGRSNSHARNGGENLARILGEMSRPGINLEKRRDGDRSLRDYVEAEARDLSGQPFNKFMASLYGTIQSHISRYFAPHQLNILYFLTQPLSFACHCSADQNERLGGVLSVDELIDVKVSAIHAYCHTCSRSPTTYVMLDAYLAAAQSTALLLLVHWP